MHPLKFAEQRRSEAERLRALGADEAATASETLADELEDAWTAYQNELLTLKEASDEGGYSKSRLSSLVGDKIPNAGEPGKPRIKRKHVPKQPGVSIESSEGGDTADETSNRTSKPKSDIADEIL